MATGRMGWAVYSRILGSVWAEPATYEQLQLKFDRGSQKMRELLWRMERAGLVRVVGWVQSERSIASGGPRGMPIPTFGPRRAGSDESVPYPGSLRRAAHGDTANLRRPRAEFVAWLLIIEAMRDGATRDEIREETGAAHHRIRAMVKALEEVGMVHTAAWRKSPSGIGSPARVLKFGPGTNKRKPAPKSRAQVMADHNARMRDRRASSRAAKHGGAGAGAMAVMRRKLVAGIGAGAQA